MLRQVAGCDDGVTCPGVWVDEDNDQVLIRGQVTPGLPLGDGEQVVAIPIGMLTTAARLLVG